MAPTHLLFILLIFWAVIFFALWMAQRSIWKSRKGIRDRRRDIVDRMRKNIRIS